MSRLVTHLLLTVALGVSGCASFNTMTSARVLKPGTMRATPAITVGGAETDQKANIETVQPQLEIGLAVGVLEDLEVGVRLWTLPSRQLYTVGGELSAKVQLNAPADPTRGVHVALAPRLSMHRVGSESAGANAISLALPLLLGFTFGNMNELILGPQVRGQVLWMEGGSDIYALTVGSSVGALLWVSECFGLMPEFSVHWSTLTAEGGDRIWFWQAGVAVVFDIDL